MHTLVIGVTNIASSYARDCGERAIEAPDTVQWWITPQALWMISTFALDHDIHIYEVRSVPPDPVDFAVRSMRKNYGDVLTSEHVLRFDAQPDRERLIRACSDAGLSPLIDFTAQGCPFWKPDDAEYTTQTRP